MFNSDEACKRKKEQKSNFKFISLQLYCLYSTIYWQESGCSFKKKKKKEKCKLPRHAVLSMGCYILSWYNPHFWVFRSMKLQRVTMTTGINPRDAEECQQSWIYISREKTGRYAVLCCAPMSFWNSYTSSCAAQTKAYQIYIYVQVYLNWNQLHLA